jgi:rhodanese-related sulfurtransferase
MMNITGYESIDEVIKHGTKAMDIHEFIAVAEDTNATIIDTRDPQEFAKGFIPGSYNIGLDGTFANWVGVIFEDVKHPLLFIADEGHEEEVAIRLARIGFDNAKGYLKGGVKAWEKDDRVLDSIQSVSVDTLAKVDAPNILDVRKKSEYDSEHVIGAVNAPLDYWKDNLAQVDKNKTWYVHCAGGYRSMIFTSILRSLGYRNLIDVKGGFKAIKESEKFKISEYVCPTTML